METAYTYVAIDDETKERLSGPVMAESIVDAAGKLTSVGRTAISIVAVEPAKPVFEKPTELPPWWVTFPSLYKKDYVCLDMRNIITIRPGESNGVPYVCLSLNDKTSASVIVSSVKEITDAMAVARHEGQKHDAALMAKLKPAPRRRRRTTAKKGK
jgi:hypothetical protein